MEPLVFLASQRRSNCFSNQEVKLEIYLKRKEVDKNSNYYLLNPAKFDSQVINNEKFSSSGIESTCEMRQDLYSKIKFSKQHLGEISTFYRNNNYPMNSDLELSIYKSPSSIPRITQMDFQLKSKQLLANKSNFRNCHNIENAKKGRNYIIHKNNSSIPEKTSIFIPIKTTNNSYFSTKLFRKLSSGTLTKVFNKSEEIKLITKRLNQFKSEISKIESEDRNMKIIFQPKRQKIKFDSFTEFLKLSNMYKLQSQKIIQQNHANKLLFQRHRIGNSKKS